MSCLDEKEEESIEHLLCECPVLRGGRLQLLGMHSFQDLDCSTNKRSESKVRVSSFENGMQIHPIPKNSQCF